MENNENNNIITIRCFKISRIFKKKKLLTKIQLDEKILSHVIVVFMYALQRLLAYPFVLNCPTNADADEALPPFVPC